MTVGLAVDFIGAGQIGQWLAVETEVIKTGSTICFAQCLIKADGVVIARANAHLPRGAEEAVTLSAAQPKCQSAVSVTRSMKARTLADNSREVG